MDGFEFNKIAGAVLATGLGVLGLGIIAEFIYEPIEAEEPAYVIAVATTGEEGDIGGGAAEVDPIAVRLQVADAGAGETEAKKCVACHTFDQGGPARVGPNLWNVVGRPMASLSGFGYSSSMLDASEGGEPWTYENLDAFLAAPKQAIPGTSMAFVGVKKPNSRADVIAFLRTLSDSPQPLPEPLAPETDTAAMPESDMPADAADAMPADAGADADEDMPADPDAAE